jgi:hypothetical protein
MQLTNLFHPSARPAGHGITIGTPRLYDLSAALFSGQRRAYRTLLAAGDVQRGDRARRRVRLRLLRADAGRGGRSRGLCRRHRRGSRDDRLRKPEGPSP